MVYEYGVFAQIIHFPAQLTVLAKVQAPRIISREKRKGVGQKLNFEAAERHRIAFVVCHLTGEGSLESKGGKNCCTPELSSWNVSLKSAVSGRK